MKKKLKGRGKDHYWRFVKFKGDAAVYSICSCGFRYSCCKNENLTGIKFVPDPTRLYPYCPYCGSRKTHSFDEVEQLNKYSFE